jgi:hypothetical protein
VAAARSTGAGQAAHPVGLLGGSGAAAIGAAADDGKADVYLLLLVRGACVSRFKSLITINMRPSVFHAAVSFMLCPAIARTSS